MSVALQQIETYINERLQASRYKDYCPNGLQVESSTEVAKLATAVTASASVIRAAAEWGADALLVHHGYFWRGEPAPLIGLKGERVRALIKNEISLLAYHLPLDDHPEVGNNSQLAKRLGIRAVGPLFPDGSSVGLIGELDKPLSLDEFLAVVEAALERKPLHVGEGVELIRRVALCTGGAQGYLEQAVSMGADLYLSGEISEQTTHIARETRTHYVAAGHHATERYGVQALGAELEVKFDLVHQFFDDDNPA